MTDTPEGFCDCGPAGVELPGGWTLHGPPGTSREALEYAARRYEDDDYLPSVDDAEDAAEQAARDAIGPVQGPPTHHQHLMNERLKQTLAGMLAGTGLSEFLFRDPNEAQRSGTVVYETTNPSDPDTGWVKRMMLDGVPARGSAERAQYEGNWTGERVDTTARHTAEFTVDVSHDHVRMWERQPADTLTGETFDRIHKWAAHPPARPGWTGSVTGPPRPAPVKPSPWETLPKGVHNGNRTVIIEPGADSNPNARLMDMHGNDLGPAFPNGLGKAYTGRPAPIPWDSPLADPIADLKAAAEETL